MNWTPKQKAGSGISEVTQCSVKGSYNVWWHHPQSGVPVGFSFFSFLIKHLPWNPPFHIWKITSAPAIATSLKRGWGVTEGVPLRWLRKPSHWTGLWIVVVSEARSGPVTVCAGFWDCLWQKFKANATQREEKTLEKMTRVHEATKTQIHTALMLACRHMRARAHTHIFS